MKVRAILSPLSGTGEHGIGMTEVDKGPDSGWDPWMSSVP